MPISPIILQRRHAELGRIRLGQKGAKGQPQKLDRFRFTSASDQHIADIAALYGGQARPWDNNGKPEHEVITEATSIPVIAVKGGLSQWMETWSGGGCVHRCDGQVQADGTPCDENDRAHLAAKPTTRLSVMLPELDALGVWRLESHGWNAAAEIPAIAELAAYVGDLVPATLHLMERRSVRDGKTSRFVVPVLDLRIGRARLQEVVARVSGGAPELGGATADGPAAIEAATSTAATAPDVGWYTARAADCSSLDELRALWQEAVEAGHLTDDVKATLTSRVEQIKADAQAAADPDGAVDAETVEEKTQPSARQSSDDPDAVWKDIVVEGARLGMTPDDAQADFRTFMSGLSASEASAAELDEYLTDLTKREAPEGAVA